MTYHELIEQLLKQIAAHTGDALSREQAIKEGKATFLEIDHHKEYGGYRIVTIKVDGGSAHPALGYNDISSRISAKQMAERLSNILKGIELVKPAQ